MTQKIHSVSSDYAFNKWGEYFQELACKEPISWPSETVVRLFRGNYVQGMPRELQGKKVCEIGFGDGNNLNFFGSLGMDIYGTEVDSRICETTTARLTKFGYAPHLLVGTNRSLPFADDTFDFLVSWNCVHYEESEMNIIAAIKEYSRILKPGGRFFISTTAPENLILKNSTKVGDHLHRIGLEHDLRCGQTFFYFDNEAEIKEYFSVQFKKVEVGRVHDVLFGHHLDWFIVTGVK